MKNSIEKFKELKRKSGTHSPSIQTILTEIPEVSIDVDACFLSNPYATELFLRYFKKELLDTAEINRVLEFYPSQSSEIAKLLGEHIGVEESRIFVSNGAIEAMQAVIHNYTLKKMVVIVPTFSAYYEFAKKGVEVVFYELDKAEDFHLNVDRYIEFIEKERPDTVVLINPNNPDGGYISQIDLIRIIESLYWVENIIVDESFIHFAYEDRGLVMKSIVNEIERFKNLVIVKSMSKDFGIAGLRCGYAVLPEAWVTELTSNGYLWNLNGLAEYFFRLYVRNDFIQEYEGVRKRYIRDSLVFFQELSGSSLFKVYPSKANFVLIEVLNGMSSAEVTARLLLDHGVYVRNCEDKIGLDGEFIRVAARSHAENKKIVNALLAVIV